MLNYKYFFLLSFLLLVQSFTAFGQYSQYYLEKGQESLEQEKFAQAENHFSSAIKHNSRNMEAYFQRAIARLKQDKHQQAQRDLERTAVFNYKPAERFFWEGVILFEQEKYQSAITKLKMALAAEPSEKSQVFTYIGHSYYELSDMKEAQQNYFSAIKHGATNKAELHYKLAEIYYLDKSYEQAIKNLKLARQHGYPERAKIAKQIVVIDKKLNEARKTGKFYFSVPSGTRTSSESAFYDIDVCVESPLRVEEVTIYLNGKAQDTGRGLILTQKNSCPVRVEQKIYLQKGLNSLYLEAHTAAGTFRSETRTIEYLPTPSTANHSTSTTVQEMPRVWAVIVGVATYSHMPTLRYSDDDAYRMYAFFKSPEGGAIPEEQISLLVDENATKGNITRALENKFEKASEDDLVIFYYAGHGLEGSFLPFDYDGTSPTKLMHADVQQIFSHSLAKNKLFVADACHSGSSNENFRTVEKTMNNYYQALAKTSGGTALMMSSKAEETSIENKGLRQGVFSHYLIKGLKGEADFDFNGIITVRELFDYAQTQTRQYTRFRQNPELFGLFDPNMPVGAVRR